MEKTREETLNTYSLVNGKCPEKGIMTENKEKNKCSKTALLTFSNKKRIRRSFFVIGNN